MKRMLKTALTLSAALLSAALAAPIADNTIAGQITDWPAGKTGEVRLVVMSGMPNWIDETVLARGNVDEKGNFTLALPGAAATEKVLPDAAPMGKLAYSLPIGESNSLMNLSEASRVNLFQLVAYQGETKLGTVKLGSTPRRNLVKGDQFALLGYSSAATTLSTELSGYHRALMQSTKQIWNVPLKTGWNWVAGQVGDFDASAGLWEVTYTAAERPKTLAFRLQEGVSGIGFVLGSNNSANEDINVANVLPGSPAEKAGLRLGDVIVTWNGVKLSSLPSANEPLLIHTVLRGEVGTPVVLTIRRGSETSELKLERALLPASVPQNTY